MTPRAYHIEVNTDHLTSGTYPWRVVCDDDGWVLPCRTYQVAMRHEALLNTLDAAPALIEAQAKEMLQ